MKACVMLAQIGTLDETTTEALKPYLRAFVLGRRVIDYLPILW